jgi:hypothetical protein
MLRLLVSANVVHSSPTLVTLKMEAICSSETLVLTKVTLRNISEYGILHSHRRSNLKALSFVSKTARLTETHLWSQNIGQSVYA